MYFTDCRTYGQKRNYGINKILPDYKCLMKMMEILSDEAEIDGTIAKVRNMLNNSFMKLIY